MIFTMILWPNGSRIINRVPPYYVTTLIWEQRKLMCF